GRFLTRFLTIPGDIPPAKQTWIQRLKTRISHWKIATSGFSHGGYAQVLEDQTQEFPKGAESWLDEPLANVLGLDIYDDTAGGPGGGRWQGLESFAPEGLFLKIGFVEYDAQMVWDLVQKQVKEVKEGKWDPVAWEAFEGKEDANGNTI